MRRRDKVKKRSKVRCLETEFIEEQQGKLKKKLDEGKDWWWKK